MRRHLRVTMVLKECIVRHSERSEESLWV